MPDLDWPAIQAEATQRRRVRLTQEWAEHVLSVPVERRLYIGKLDTWRYMFFHNNELVSVPLYEHPNTGGYMAVLPEDWGDAREWGIAFMTPLSEFPGRGL